MAMPKEQEDRFNAFNFTSSFERASLIFKEIESILESELADTPQIVANYEQNIARVKSKRKRGGPFLIKPLNKSKARKTLNDMEFDPVLGVWVGNDEVMKTFAQHKPALIINKGQTNKPKKEGNMVWDATEHKWRGNEEDLRVFGAKQVPLIAAKSANVYMKKEINGMSFDPVKMRWVGNETDLDLLDFASISEQLTDDGFVVGNEFQLSPAAIQLFTDCANRHKISTAGWWQDEKSRTHLHVIRTMSIVRVVRDVKRTAYAFYEEPSDMDIAQDKDALVPEGLKSPAEADLDDASWDDVGEFSGSGPLKIKLPEASSNSVDIDFDFDQEPGKEEKKSLSRSGKQRDLVEDWDNDFEDDGDKLQNKIVSTPGNKGTIAPGGSVTGTINGFGTGTFNLGLVTNMNNRGGSMSEKKPFALLKADAPARRSFILPTANVQKPKASDEDDEFGLEIPTEPLKLKLNRVPPTTTTVPDEDVDLDGEGALDSGSNTDELFEEEEEMEEEDWGDVEVPTSLGEPVTKRPEHLQKLNAQPSGAEREEWDDMEIPADKLAIKVAQQKLAAQNAAPTQATQKPNKSKGDDEEGWDDLDIPDNFQDRLKAKKK